MEIQKKYNQVLGKNITSSIVDDFLLCIILCNYLRKMKAKPMCPAIISKIFMFLLLAAVTPRTEDFL